MIDAKCLWAFIFCCDQLVIYDGTIMKMRSLFALSIALCMNQVSAYDITGLVKGREVSEESRNQFKTLDQPFCFFKTISEDPYMIVFHPGKNEINSVICGTRDKERGPRRAKKAIDFANLIAIRNVVLFADAGLKLDEKFRGYRKTVIGSFLDKALKTISVLPDRKYKGLALVDEYKAGLPMKWVLRDAQDLTNVRKYLEKHFRKMAIVPAKKPLLVLEITNSPDLFASARGIDGLAEADVDFLENYFELADPMNPEVCEFFQRCQFDFMETMYKMGDAKTVGKSFGEIIFDDIEKKSIDFKAVDAAGVLMTVIIGWLVFESCKEALKGHVVKPVQNEFVEHFGITEKIAKFKKTVGENKLVISGVTASLLAAWIAYKLATQEAEEDMFIEDVVDIDSVQEVEEVVQA